jgi:glycosyltransferase involved in cell wall biosynthesis
LEELMQDEVLRERLGGRATEAARRFSKAAFLDRWEKLIEELAQAGAPAPGGAG